MKRLLALAAVAAALSGCGPADRYNCGDFPLDDGTTAQQYLDQNSGDPSKLDKNDDGKACN